MMKDTFIRLLKDNHAFSEFNDVIELTTYMDFDQMWNFVELKHEILSDGHVIFWKNGLSDVDWEALDKKWRSYLDGIGYMSSVYTEPCRDGLDEEHY